MVGLASDANMPCVSAQAPTSFEAEKICPRNEMIKDVVRKGGAAEGFAAKLGVQAKELV
jgi:hypothetical protein